MALDAGPHLQEAAALAYRCGGMLVWADPRHNMEKSVNEVMRSVTHTVLSHLVLDWHGVQVTDLLPCRQDMQLGRPLLITGRFQGQPPAEVGIAGQGSGKITARAISLPSRQNGAHLAAAWAKMKMTDLALGNNQKTQDAIDDHIRRMALEFGLISPFTSYICVDASTQASPAR
jgi:Ca-activated chloride channel homolog